LRRLSGRGGGLGRGDRGWAKKAPPAVGHDPGSFGLKGLAARVYFAFTYSSPPAPATPSPAAMARIIRGRKGAGGHAGDMRDRLGNAPAQDPRKSRPRPHSMLKAIALGRRA
jgi:hypothetical protein